MRERIIEMEKDYYKFCREERNITAILYHALLRRANLKKFLSLISCKNLGSFEEASIYFEYAYLRDWWRKEFPPENAATEGRKAANQKAKDRILSALNLSEEKGLGGKIESEFNSYFGATPTPSSKYIQMPATWSAEHYKKNIIDDCDFRKVCKLKWAFKAKPDIVIIGEDAAVCVEAKWDSSVGKYKEKNKSGEEFSCTQTSIQEYMFKSILGIDKTEFILLAKTKRSKSEPHKTVTWSEVFSKMDVGESLGFVRDWTDYLKKVC